MFATRLLEWLRFTLAFSSALRVAVAAWAAGVGVDDVNGQIPPLCFLCFRVFLGIPILSLEFTDALCHDDSYDFYAIYDFFYALQTLHIPQ